MTIGEEIRSLRKGQGLTLEGLGLASGVSWNTIARIESGRHKSPRWATVEKLLAALGRKTAKVQQP